MSRRRTHYEALGIAPDAKHTEIGLAYNRKIAAQGRDDEPPDPRGSAALKEAFEVLSDLDARAAYDAQLRAVRVKPAVGRAHALYAAGFVALIAGGVYFHLKPGEAPGGPGKPYEQILNGAVPAVARLQAVDMTGRPQAAGVAFAIAPGVLVTSCRGLSPTAQVTVSFAQRVVPARVALADEATGFCKLDVAGAGSWPLPVSPEAANVGDRVYVTQVGATGEVTLREARVSSVKAATDAKAQVIETSVPVMAEQGGAPLLDIHGRVVAVASSAAGSNVSYIALSHRWSESVKPPDAPRPSDSPRRAEEPRLAEPAPAEVDDLGLGPRAVQQPLPPGITPERKERLEKAFRPPPTVPEDL